MSIDTLLGIAAILVLAFSVPFDGARDGGHNKLRMWPLAKLPWPLRDPFHMDKYASVVPLWLLAVGVILHSFGWKALATVGLLAIWCSWGWHVMVHRRLRSVGDPARWPTVWSALMRLVGRLRR